VRFAAVAIGLAVVAVAEAAVYLVQQLS